jgi:AcrR family transcriptional regulator
MSVVSESELIASQIRILIESGHLVDPDSAKGRLLQEAATLFNEKGYERTTVRDLATAVGIQSGSLFHHFPNKDAILKAVMEQAIRFNTARMRIRLAAAHSTRDKLRALILCELESVVGVTGDAMTVLVYEWRSLSPDSQQEILALRDVYEDLWLTTITAAKQEGLVSGDPFIIRRFLTGALSWTKTWFKVGGPMSVEQLADEALGLVVR